MDEIPRRSRLAVRAQVGRLPLPRLPRRRPDRAPVEDRPAAGPLLPGGGRAPARAARPPLRARRRDRHPAGRPPVLRRSPPAHPPGREPDRAALAGAPRGAHRLRPAGGRAGQALVDRPLLRAPAAPGSLRGARRSPVATTSGSPPPRRTRPRRAPGSTWRGGTLDGVVAKRLDLPYQRGERDRHAEGQAPPHGGLRGGRLPSTHRARGWSARSSSASTTRTGCSTTSASRPASRPPTARRSWPSCEPADQAARVHGPRAGRAQPMEHRALGGMGAARAQAGRRGELRPLHRRSLPPRHALPALAARQGAAPVHPRPGRAQ